MNTPQSCPECHRTDLYTSEVNSYGNRGPYLLPGLGGFLYYAKFNIIICGQCGLTRFYAEPRALAKLPKASQWKRL